MNILSWPEVEPIAKQLFRNGYKNRDLKWAEWVWSVFTVLKITCYDNYTQKLDAIKNVICIHFICCDFLELYDDYHIDYTTEDFVSIISKNYPELTPLVNVGNKTDIFESINSNERRKHIAQVLNSWYMASQNFNLSNLNRGLFEDLESTIGGKNLFEDYDGDWSLESMSDKQVVFFEKVGNVITWIKDENCSKLK